jgi:hypothetical protein
MFQHSRETETTAYAWPAHRRYRQKIALVPDIWMFLEIFSVKSELNVSAVNATCAHHLRPPSRPDLERHLMVGKP